MGKNIRTCFLLNKNVHVGILRMYSFVIQECTFLLYKSVHSCKC